MSVSETILDAFVATFAAEPLDAAILRNLIDNSLCDDLICSELVVMEGRKVAVLCSYADNDETFAHHVTSARSSRKVINDKLEENLEYHLFRKSVELD